MPDDYDKDEVLEKEINQLDTIDETVDRVITDMGSIWKKCCDKLETDSICYLCKRKLDEEEGFDMVSVPAEKSDKGIFIIASICKTCNK